jgi:hypothetical protein
LQGQCRLGLVSATQIRLIPFNGNLLTVNGVNCTVPDAGVTYTVSGLAASTSYFVYATQSGGAINALELSATTYAVDTAAGNKGNRIKSGDPNRTLVGWVRTNGAIQFVDSASQRFVRSWHNRKRAYLNGAATGTVALNAVAQELATASRVEFLQWDDEGVDSVLSASYSSGTAGLAVNMWSAIDGVASGNSAVANTDGSARALPMSVRTCVNPAEGYHYVTPFASISSGAGNAHNASVSVVVG